MGAVVLVVLAVVGGVLLRRHMNQRQQQKHKARPRVGQADVPGDYYDYIEDDGDGEEKVI